MMAPALLIMLVLLGWYAWEKLHRRTYPVSGGLHRDIKLPYEEEFELYHNGLSLCSKKVRVCLVELDIPFAQHHIDLIETGAYGGLSRAFLKVNPAGLLPVLVHNGHPVYESHDIITYCAALVDDGGRGLVPKDPAQCEIMTRWMDRASIKGEDVMATMAQSAADCAAVLTLPLFCSAMVEIPSARVVEGLLFHRIKFRPALFLVLKIRGLRGLPALKPARRSLARAHQTMGRHLDDLEEHLQSQQWICASGFSLADISWMVIFDRLVEADWLDSLVGHDLRPGLWAYWQRLKQRPGYAGVSQYRLPIVERATGRIRSHKKNHPEYTAALTAGG